MPAKDAKNTKKEIKIQIFFASFRVFRGQTILGCFSWILRKIGMKIFLYSLGLLLVLSSGVFAQNWNWKTFSPENGAWSITAPGVMRPDEEALEPDSNKGSYSYNDFDGFFAVIYRDSPKRWVPWKPNYSSYYKRITKDFIKAAKGTLLKETEFTKGDWKGREVYIRVPVGTITGTEGQSVPKYRTERLRMFFHGKRFYLLLAVVRPADVDSPGVNQFFDSFTAK